MKYLIQWYRCLKCYREYPLAFGFPAGSHGPKDDRCPGGAWEPVDDDIQVLETHPIQRLTPEELEQKIRSYRDMTLPEARNVIYDAAERWADELATWIIPGTIDEDVVASYQRQLGDLEVALKRVRQEAYNGYTPED